MTPERKVEERLSYVRCWREETDARHVDLLLNHVVEYNMRANQGLGSGICLRTPNLPLSDLSLSAISPGFEYRALNALPSPTHKDRQS